MGLGPSYQENFWGHAFYWLRIPPPTTGSEYYCVDKITEDLKIPRLFTLCFLPKLGPVNPQYLVSSLHFLSKLHSIFINSIILATCVPTLFKNFLEIQNVDVQNLDITIILFLLFKNLRDHLSTDLCESPLSFQSISGDSLSVFFRSYLNSHKNFAI